MRPLRVVVALLVLLPVLVLAGAGPSSAVSAEIILAAPASVEPGAQITVTGTLLHSDGTPYIHADVTTRLFCLDPQEVLPEGGVRTDSQGGFSFGITAAVCSIYRLAAMFVDPSTGDEVYEFVDVAVNRTPTAMTVTVPATAYTQDEFPITVSLTAAGAPLAEAAVRLVRYGPVQSSWDLTTDQNGVAVVTDSIAVPGSFYYTGAFEGTVTENHVYENSSYLVVARRPVAMTFTGPATAAVDQPFTVSGTLSGPPLPAEVVITGPQGFTATVPTDADGHFSLEVETPIGGYLGWTAAFAQTPAYAGAQRGIVVNVAKLSTQIVASVEPGAIQPFNGDAMVSGTVVGVDTPVQVTMSYYSRSMGVAMTDSSGAFSFPIHDPDMGVGQAQLTLSVPNSDRYVGTSQTVALQVDGLPATIAVDPIWPVQTGQPFTISGLVTGAVVPFQNYSGVIITNGTRQWAAHAEPDGHFRIPVVASAVTGPTTYTVTLEPFTGYHVASPPGSVVVVQKARPQLLLRPLRRRFVNGAISGYRLADDPVLVTTQSPNVGGSCHRYVIQRFLNGAWRGVRASHCVPVNANGVSRWQWAAMPVRGVTYRVVSVLPPSMRTFRVTSAPRYIRFR